MTPFLSMVQASNPVEKSLEMVIDVFASFYHGLTNKNQQRLKFLIVGADKSNTEKVTALAKNFEIGHTVEFVSAADASTKGYGAATVLVEAATGEDDSFIIDGLGHGLPVLTFITPARREILDNSCAVMVKYRDYEANVNSLANALEIIYFDPEARKMLRRGALSKHATLTKQQTK